MKVGFESLQNKNNNRAKLNFTGYKPIKNDYGQREYEFNYVYDDSKKDCYLEVFLVDKDDNGNFIISGDRDMSGNVKPLINYNTGSIDYKLESGKSTKINLASTYGIEPNQAFAYHYVLRPKDMPDGIPEYKIDPGNVVNGIENDQTLHRIYNIVSDRAATVSKGGAMKLILPDINNVAWVYDRDNNIIENPNIDRARKTNKNIFNKIGGSIAGIEKDLDEGKLDNYTRIITTPLFTDDTVSAHAYWNKNCMQMAHSLGNINNYSSLQRKLFAKGINLVSDGAYVNEGLEGVHFRHVLLWGKKSPYFNWFRISGLQDSPLSMGVFGKKLDHVTHRLVNSKYDYKQVDGKIKITTNKNYKSNQPTYIQIYDDRLVNLQNLDEKDFIKAYDKILENNLDINNHNDSIVPYRFQIDSETYKKNVILLNNYNKSNLENVIDLYSGEGTRAVSQFEFFGLDGKHESGFETWDANPDIAKLNYIPSNNETMQSKNILDAHEKAEFKKNLIRKNMEVQDYAVTSAKYWTKKTKDILLVDIAQNLKHIDNLDASLIADIINNKLADGKRLPNDLSVSEKVIANVLKDRYELSNTDVEENYDKAILQGIMNLPLDSVEVGDDIVSVLASPFMSKRATKPSEIGVSRYDLYTQGNKHVAEEYSRAYKRTDKMYENEMFKFAKDILDAVEKNLTNNQLLKDENGNTTSYGEYVLPILTAEIARFAVIKGVSPDAEMKYDINSGEISYDYEKTKSTNLLQMGIIADSPEDEAISLVNKLKSNIKKISAQDKEELVNALTKSLEGTSYRSFALADMIIDKTGAGLDWRIDATKDIADIDSLKSGKTDYEYTWNKIIEFWSRFTEGVREYHDDAYIAAEITDADDIYNKGAGHLSGTRFSNAKEGVKKLINEAGFTTIANYDYLSSSITQIFGKLFDYNGTDSPDKGLIHGTDIHDQLSFYYQKEPLESVLYSYTFAGNHDKCRALEGYAVDMSMVYEDLNNHANFELRKRAYKVLHGMPFGVEPSTKDINEYDYSLVSNIAVAKCESIASGMGKAKEKIGLSEQRKNFVYDTMLKALANLANGKHKDKIFEAEGFGTKDFDTALDIVLDEMDYIGHQSGNTLSKDERKRLKNETFKNIVDPAISKLLGQLKFLVALNGNPTLFSGDDYGSTGYETTTKNIFLQNRNIIREDWADENSPDYKPFIKTHKDDIDKIFAMRKHPELQALNDGTPYILDVHGAHYKKAVYKDFEGEQLDHYESGNTSVSAILKQSPNGAMTISLFNTEGLTHDFDQYYRPAEITLSSIGLGSGQYEKYSVISGLKDGTRFYDAKELNKPIKDRTVYEVKDNVIRRNDGQPIVFNDSTLILCYHPIQQVSFTGKKVLYNPQYNFVSNPYATKQNTVSNKLFIG